MEKNRSGFYVYCSSCWNTVPTIFVADWIKWWDFCSFLLSLSTFLVFIFIWGRYCLRGHLLWFVGVVVVFYNCELVMYDKCFDLVQLIWHYYTMLIYQKDLPIRLGAVVVVQTQLSAKTLNMCVYSQLFWKEENKELEACNGPIKFALHDDIRSRGFQIKSILILIKLYSYVRGT